MVKYPVRRWSTKGFTLIELGVTILIIAVLVGAIFPAVSTMRDSARKAGCAANLKSLGICVTMYLSDNAGRMFPRDSSNGMQPLEHNLMPYFDQVEKTNNCVIRGSSGQLQYGTNDRLNNRRVLAVSSPSTTIMIADSFTSACYDYCVPIDRRIDYRHRLATNLLFMDMRVGWEKYLIGNPNATF